MFIFIYIWYLGFPCGLTSKESTCNVGDLGSIPGLGRSPGEGKGYPLQYSGLENSLDSIVHGVAKSWRWLRDVHFHFWYLFFKGRLRHHKTKGKWPLTSNQRTSYKGAEVWGFSKGFSIKHNVNIFFFLQHHTACELLVRQPGMEPTPSALEAWNLNLWTTKEVPKVWKF